MSKLAETSNAKKGGLFTGKSHAEGGIPAIVTDTGQPIEVESGEAIITKKATAMFCEELSEINQAGGGVPIPCPTDVDKIMDKFERGGITTQKEKKQVYDKWKSLVNMTQTELKNYQKSKDGKSSGLSKSDADNLNISSGRESAEWILKMKQLNYKSWTSTMWKWANKQISFISRMRGVKGVYFDEDNNRTPKLKALLIWGHNPAKFNDGGSVVKIAPPLAKYRILRANNRIKYAGTDNPSWLTLEQAQKLVDYSSGEMIYQFDETGEKLYEVFKDGGSLEQHTEKKDTIKNGYLYFYDNAIKLWTAYPVDDNGNRIEFDVNENFIEADYFANKNQLIKYLDTKTTTPEIMATGKLISNDSATPNEQYINYLVEVGKEDAVENYNLVNYLKSKGLSTLGLLPDEVRADPEYRKVKQAYDIASNKAKRLSAMYSFAKFYKKRDREQQFKDRATAKAIIDKFVEDSPNKKEFNNTSMETPKKITFSKDALKVVPTHQLKYLKSTDFSEMEDAITQINEAVFSVPKLYGQDGVPDKMIYLHYFNGNQDWHITEYDRNSGEAFGYANLGYGAELGYMSIPEIVDSTVQLDFYFKPTLWSEINEDEDSAFEKQNNSVSKQAESDLDFDFETPNENGAKLMSIFKKNWTVKPDDISSNALILQTKFNDVLFQFEVFDNTTEFKIDCIHPNDNMVTLNPVPTTKNGRLKNLKEIAVELGNELIDAMVEYTEKHKPTPAPNKISLTDFANQMGIEVTHMDEPEPAKNVESNEISLDVKTYKNPYELNKSIEKWIDNNVGSIENVSKRTYSTEEKLFIRNYTGYGGLGKFGETTVGSMFEFFTPTKVIKTMWALAYKYGYSVEKSILETSVGTGEFLQFASPDTRKVAYEINKYSATITKILYPTTEVRLEPFEKMFIKDNYTIKGKLDNLEKFDMVIGNPPYGSFDVLDSKASRYLLGMGEKDYTNAHNYVEYFLRRSLDVLKPNGLIVMIVGAELKNGGTMFLDSKESPVKQFLNENAILLDAYRLPDSTFERTGVTTDILVIQKK